MPTPFQLGSSGKCVTPDGGDYHFQRFRDYDGRYKVLVVIAGQCREFHEYQFADRFRVIREASE